MKVRYLRTAVSDLREAIDYYEGANPQAAQAFRDVYRRALDQIVSHPYAWRIVADDFRQHRLKRFPYSVIYQVVDDWILVVAIRNLHGDPTNWRLRIG